MAFKCFKCGMEFSEEQIEVEEQLLKTPEIFKTVPLGPDAIRIRTLAQIIREHPCKPQEGK